MPEDSGECSICHDSLINPKTLHCNHTFCSECISSWLRIHPTCPVCRSTGHGQFMFTAFPAPINEILNTLPINQQMILVEHMLGMQSAHALAVIIVHFLGDILYFMFLWSNNWLHYIFVLYSLWKFIQKCVFTYQLIKYHFLIRRALRN